MILKRFFILMMVLTGTFVVFAITGAALFGQPPQPGDTPAPVVDSSPDVFEVGLVSASITCPQKVAACSVLVLDVSGTSQGKRTLRFSPSVPDTAIQYDSDGDTIYVWIRKAGSYGVLWDVRNGDGKAGDGTGFMVLSANGDNPIPPDINGITEVIVRGWLKDVPKAVRDEAIVDPVTGEKYTRQEAVGKTFSQIGGTAKALGSVRAANVMLTTGLVASFGQHADGWKSFAVLADAALKELEDDGISPVEYGKVLSLIGGVLQ